MNGGCSFSIYKLLNNFRHISGQKSWKLLGERRPEGAVTFNHFRLLDPSKGREPKGIDTQVLVAEPRHDYVTIWHQVFFIKMWGSLKPRRDRKAISGFAALLCTLPSGSTRVDPLSPARVLTHKSRKKPHQRRQRLFRKSQLTRVEHLWVWFVRVLPPRTTRRQPNFPESAGSTKKV